MNRLITISGIVPFHLQLFKINELVSTLGFVNPGRQKENIYCHLPFTERLTTTWSKNKPLIKFTNKYLQIIRIYFPSFYA